MALYGQVYEEGLLIAHGGGRNGKSTFFNSVAGVLGDYAGSMDSALLTTTYKGKRGNEMYSLVGKRLVICGEFEQHQRLASGVLKQITSTDAMQVEKKYHDAEAVTPSHTICLYTNNDLRIPDRDGGTWRRIRLVPFNARIPEGLGITNYAQQLVEQAGGAILTWAVDGAVRFAQNGYKLNTPKSVTDAVAAYRHQEDWLQRFIADRCTLPPKGQDPMRYRAQARPLYESYKKWAQDVGEHVNRELDFSNEMKNAGFESRNHSGRRVYIGIYNPNEYQQYPDSGGAVG